MIEFDFFSVDIVYDLIRVLQDNFSFVDMLSKVNQNYGPQQSQELVTWLLTKLTVMKIWFICNSRHSWGLINIPWQMDTKVPNLESWSSRK